MADADKAPPELCIPDEEEVRNLYVNHCDPAALRDDDFNAEFDRFLARVRRAAAREALDGLVRAEADMYLTRCQREDYRGAAWCEHARQAAEDYRDTHYPEETP